MKIISLSLANFRNYESQQVFFDSGLNVLHGKNASGKTNMLESVYLCSLLRSPRTTKDKELIRMGANRAKVTLVVEKKFRKHTITIYIDEQGKKKVAIDGIPVNLHPSRAFIRAFSQNVVPVSSASGSDSARSFSPQIDMPLPSKILPNSPNL